MNTQTNKTTKGAKKGAVVAAAAPKKEEKAVAVRKTTAAATPLSAQDQAAWGVQKLTHRDIIIPKLLAMQPMSKKVTAGEAAFGDFLDSLSGDVVGSINKPIEFIPFYMEKVYTVMEDKLGKFEFLKQVPITPENEDEEFEQVNPENKKPQKWYRTMQYYVLLPNEVEAGTAMPYVLSFRSSSARAGQKLSTTMYVRNIKAGKVPASMAMMLGGVKKTNDKGTFIVMDVSESRESTEAEVAECFNWLKTIKAGAAKVDHSDLAEEAGEARAAPTDGNEEY